MDQPYSAFADWLSKFQSVSAPIQALWLAVEDLPRPGPTLPPTAQ